MVALAAVLFVVLACVSVPQMQPAAASIEYILSDDFDSFDSSKWNASAYAAPDFGYGCGYWSETQTWLYIENTTGGVGDSAGHVGWKFYHALPVPCSGMFSASIEFRWVETSDSQMDHVRLSLDDATGDYQVNVGFEDSWAYSSQRGLQAVISDVRTFVGGLDLNGTATLTVTRDENSLVTVASDGIVFAQGVCTAEITSVGLWLYGCKYYPGASCGVNYVVAHFTPQGDYSLFDEFDVFNATTWEAMPYFAPNFTYSCGPWLEGQTWLYIENTTGGVGDSAGHVGWKFYHSLPKACPSEFQVSMELCWAESSDSQMDHVRLSLDDATGDYQVNVGFEDSWAYSSQRGLQAVISDARTFVGGLDLNGTATIAVTRDAEGLVNVSWNGTVFAQGVCTAEITSVGLWLYGCKYYPGVSCGVNRLSAHFHTQPTYRIADEFDDFNPSAWNVTPYFAPDFTYSCGHWLQGEKWLYIQNTTGGIGDEKGYVGWLFTHTLPFLCGGEFQVSMELRWAMTSDWQVDHVRLMVQDENGINRIDAGFQDSWSYSSQRCKEATVEDNYVIETGLPLSGRGTLAVTRDANHLVQVAWDGVVFAQGICTTDIGRIAVWLIGNKYYAGVSAGVNNLFGHFTREATTTSVLLINPLMAFLVLGVVCSTLVPAIAIGLYFGQRTPRASIRTPTPATRGGISAGSSQAAAIASGLVSLRCHLCGAATETGDRFCSQCGADLQT